jgi:cytochrome P450
MNLFFAGMDTSGITTGMTLYSLLKNPQHLQKVKKEIQDSIEK